MNGMGQCCCEYNLVRLDPATGNLIWRAYIAGDGTYDPTQNQVWEIEPLHGTSDMMVLVTDGLQTSVISGVTVSKCSLCRVDSTGAQIWYVNTTPYYQPNATPGMGRICGTDGTRVIFTGEHSGVPNSLAAYDYSGSFVWGVHPSPINVGTSQSIAVSSNRTLFATPSLGGNQDRTFTNSTGGAFNFSVPGFTTLGNQPLAIDQSANQYWSAKNELATDASNGVSNIYQISPTASGPNQTYTVLHTGGPLADHARWGPNAIPYTEKFHLGGTQGAIGVTSFSLSSVWSTTTVSGEAWLSPNDCDSDSSSYYFSNGNTSVGATFHAMSFDGSGNLQWAKRVFRILAGDVASAGNAIALADTGELYVGGNP